MKTHEHPLKAWLRKKKTRAYKFADDIGMPRRTLYQHISGGDANPELAAMLKIENATGITVKRQADFFKAERTRLRMAGKK